MFYSHTQMHIPDGFLSVPVSLILWAISALVIGYALRRVSRDLGERQAPLMGVLAAAIFAGQMLNFAVAGGTSGHLIGAALVTILLGPWAGILALTCVVSIQALIFQDGGLLALGANLFNMAIVGVTVSFMVFRTVRRLAGGRRWGLFAGGFLSAWLSVEAAALAVALQLALSGTSPANLAIPAMASVHALIGMGEGLITTGALAFISAARRDLLESGKLQPAGGRLVWAAGLLLALGLAIASPLASRHPDGLYSVAASQGFLQSARHPAFQVIPNYVITGMSKNAIATILAAILGTLVVFGVALAVAYSRRRRTTPSVNSQPEV